MADFNLDNFFTEQPHPQAAPAAPSQDKGGNYLDQQFAQPTTPEGKSTAQPSYLQSIGKGLARATGFPVHALDLPSTGGGPGSPRFDYLMNYDPNKDQTEEQLNKTFPNAATDPTGKVLEKGAEGAAYGTMTGVTGTVPGFLSGAASETHNIMRSGGHGREEHPYENLAVGLGAGLLGTPLVTKPVELGLKTGRSLLERFGLMESPVNKLYSDTIGNDFRVAGANDSAPWLMQMQNALREGVGGRGQIQNAEEGLFSAVENRAKEIADNMGPNLTHQELGEFIQGQIPQRVEQLIQSNRSLSTALNDIVPRVNGVDPTNFLQRLNDITQRYAGAPELGKVFGDPQVERMIMAAYRDAAQNGGVLPYQVLQNIRTDIGETIGKGVANPDVNIKMLRSLYGALTDDMESAYANTPNGLRAFRTVNAAQEANFDKLDMLQAFNKTGMNPEDITTRLLSQTSKGASRIDDITTQLNNVDPATRDTVMGHVLRNLGTTPQDHSFSPIRFYNQYQKLSPEAKALFPKAQQEGIERLAQLSGLIKEPFASSNPSHTSGNLDTLQRIGTAVRALTEGAIIGIGGGSAAAIYSHNPELAAGVAGMGAVYGIGKAMAATLGESTINNMLGRLWTNRMFNTWLATEAPHLTPDKLPMALGALAGQAPEIGKDLNTLSKIITSTSGQAQDVPQGVPGEVHKAEGGYVKEDYNDGGYAGWPEQTPTGYALGGLTNTFQPNQAPEDTEKAGKIPTLENSIPSPNVDPRYYTKGYVGGGVASSPFGIGLGGNEMIGYAEGGPAKSILDMTLAEKMQRIQQLTSDRAAYDRGDRAAGSPARSFSSITNDQTKGYSQGGVAHNASKNDSRPFYNPQLPNVVGGGWAEGGPVGSGKMTSGFQIGEYAAGGDVKDNSSILDLIMKYESAGRNVMNYINDKTHTAGGYFQITNSTWRNFAPAEVQAKYSSAISAPYNVQRAVAERILESPGGIHHWSNYNPKLAAALGGNETQVASKASSGSILDHFLGENDNEPNHESQEQQPEESTASQDSDQPAANPKVAQALSDYSFADPLTKYAIKGIWENANI